MFYFYNISVWIAMFIISIWVREDGYRLLEGKSTTTRMCTQMMSSLYMSLFPYHIFLSLLWVFLVCPDTHPSPLLLLVPNNYITPHLSPHLSPQPLYYYLLPLSPPPNLTCGVINQNPYQPTYPQNILHLFQYRYD